MHTGIILEQGTGGASMEKSMTGWAAGERQTLWHKAGLRRTARQLYGLAAGLAGGWAALYGQLSPLGLALTLGLPEDCCAACGAGAVLALLARGLGVRAVCLLCAVGGAVVARWLWPRSFWAGAAAGAGLLLGSA